MPSRTAAELAAADRRVLWHPFTQQQGWNDEVPLVIGVKQSAGDLKLFADLMLMAPDRLIYSAVDALMYPSYTLGAHGSIAAILSGAPHASVALWDAVKAGNHVQALELH